MVREQQLKDNYQECGVDECEHGSYCFDDNGPGKYCKGCLCRTCIRACYQCKEIKVN
jgi:hypothetical protein